MILGVTLDLPAIHMPPDPTPSAIQLEVQFGTTRRGVPQVRRLRSWAEAAYVAHAREHLGKRRKLRLPLAQLSLKVVGAAESRRLNREWRGKDKATNVLSFPAGEEGLPPQEHYLGDLAICVPVVAQEAKQQGKRADAHWAHMVIHGVLHLLGHDHENDRDAERMEACETSILAQFGFADPYRMDET